jgi:hypothetical protein
MIALIRGDRRAQLDVSLLALVGAAALLSVVQVQPLFALVMLVAMCVVPGAALLIRVGAPDALTAVALAVGLSLAFDTAVAAGLALTGWWHPELAAGAVAAGAVVLLVSDLRTAPANAAKLASKS